MFHVLDVGSVVGALGWAWRANWRRRVAIGSLIVVFDVPAFTVGVSGGDSSCRPVGYVNPDYGTEYHWAENTLEYGANSDRCRTTPYRTVAVAGSLLASVGILVGGWKDRETLSVAQNWRSCAELDRTVLSKRDRYETPCFQSGLDRLPRSWPEV